MHEPRLAPQPRRSIASRARFSTAMRRSSSVPNTTSASGPETTRAHHHRHADDLADHRDVVRMTHDAVRAASRQMKNRARRSRGTSRTVPSAAMAHHFRTLAAMKIARPATNHPPAAQPLRRAPSASIATKHPGIRDLHQLVHIVGQARCRRASAARARSSRHAALR